MMKAMLLAIVTLLSVSASMANLAGEWTKSDFAGTPAGRDTDGGIICITSTAVCFSIYRPKPPANGSTISVTGSGNQPCVALWDANAGIGLCGITGVSYVLTGSNYVATASTNGSTQTVNSQASVESWMDSNYP